MVESSPHWALTAIINHQLQYRQLAFAALPPLSTVCTIIVYNNGSKLTNDGIAGKA